MFGIFKILIVASIATVCLASHGELRSCYECAKKATNYFCQWDPKQIVGACCEEGSESLYC